MDFEVCCQSKILQDRPCAAVFFIEYDIPSKKAHHSLHKVTSLCTISSYKGMQHLSERNIELFSKRLYNCAKLKRSAAFFLRNIEVCSKRLTAAQSDKGVQHFFERNVELFSKRLAARWCTTVCILSYPVCCFSKLLRPYWFQDKKHGKTMVYITENK